LEGEQRGLTKDLDFLSEVFTFLGYCGA